MTSEDEKTVHQQSITGPLGEQPTAVNAAIHVACIDRGPASGRQQRVSEAAVTLAAEVQRLRVVLEAALLTIQKDAPELRRLREKYDLEQKTAFVLAQKATAMGDEVARLQAVVADQSLTIGTQKDELGRLRDAESLHDFAHSREQLGRSNRLDQMLKLLKPLPEKWRLQQRITAREADLARELATELEAILTDRTLVD